MASTLRIISIVAFALAAVAFIIAVIMFFYYKIPEVYADLSGSKVKKSIRENRKKNELSGKKYYGSSTENIERGPLTQTMHPQTEKMSDTDETTLLDQTQETFVETTLLNAEDASFEVSSETTLLNGNDTNNVSTTDELRLDDLDLNKLDSNHLMTLEKIFLTDATKVIKW